METKKYITSKSKTFKEGTNADTIIDWFVSNISIKSGDSNFTTEDLIFNTKQKYKITIVNLNE